VQCAHRVELQELRERAVREASRTLAGEARQTQNPWSHPVAPLPEQPSPQQDHAPLDKPTPNSYDQVMETLHTMPAMLDTLPLDWQVAVVKAITARTIIKAKEGLRAPSVLSA
jgi:hypothetical protein